MSRPSPGCSAAKGGYRESSTGLPRYRIRICGLLSVLEQLVHDAIDVETTPRPLVDLLHAFKLGMEVCSAQELKELPKEPEVELQRLLLRFLVERNVAAVGTKFARSETDLRVDDAFGAIVIEAKKLRTLPSEKKMKAWLSQLGSYMDQAPIRNMGVLLFFNFSNGSIIVPSEARFGNDRYHVVAINLCPDSPSKSRDRDSAGGGRPQSLISLRRPLRSG